MKDVFSGQDLRFLKALNIADAPAKTTELAEVHQALTDRERELIRLTAGAMVDAWWKQ